MLTGCAILFAIVLGVNLLPAFGPPTWSVIVLYGLNSQLPWPVLVLTAALAAALGRFLLAHAFRLLAGRLSAKTRSNLKAARAALEKNRRNAILALGLFALSPLPSAQLFEAAGLAGVRLFGFTAAFFAGRLVSYSIYAFTAHEIGRSSLGDAFRESLTSPVGLAIQVAMIALLVAFARIDWAKRLGGRD
ncbi:MAG TPA: hypothetical protein VIT38_07060 [Allosphingosinicella sp.]|jgi:uncharacterized membrane protein YdjX (TVP38/TMEM64 family)